MTKSEKTGKVRTDENVTLTVEQLREMIANSQASLKESIRQHNFNFGLQLSKGDRDEILALVNCKALHAAESYNPALGKLETWMSRIARNAIIDYLKSKVECATQQILYVDESDDEGRFSDSIRQMHYRLEEVETQRVGLEKKEGERESVLRMRCLNDAILSLKDRDRSVVYMLIDGVSGKEMAERLGISECAQRKLVLDVRKRLRNILARMHYADIVELSANLSIETGPEEVSELIFGLLRASRSEMNG